MPRSSAATPEAYLAELPPERRAVVATVRGLILENLPEGYEEAIGFGMLTYGIPLARYPNTYNRQPLGYVALAAHRNYYTLYLMNVYADSELERQLRAAYEQADRKLDFGKSCLRFRQLDDLVVPAIAKIIGSTTPEEHIARYEASRPRKPRARR